MKKTFGELAENKRKETVALRYVIEKSKTAIFGIYELPTVSYFTQYNKKIVYNTSVYAKVFKKNSKFLSCRML